jgi:hypothetical protein
VSNFKRKGEYLGWTYIKAVVDAVASDWVRAEAVQETLVVFVAVEIRVGVGSRPRCVLVWIKGWRRGMMVIPGP